jgi:hypothetical protein
METHLRAIPYNRPFLRNSSISATLRPVNLEITSASARCLAMRVSPPEGGSAMISSSLAFDRLVLLIGLAGST